MTYLIQTRKEEVDARRQEASAQHPCATSLAIDGKFSTLQARCWRASVAVRLPARSDV
jgi:hypothetical protein